MYSKNDKRRLYWLIDEYLAGNINESIFCDEYYYSYNLEIESNMLNSKEKQAFGELGEVAVRFSPFEEDYKIALNAYYTVDELKQKITETKEKLKGQNID